VLGDAVSAAVAPGWSVWRRSRPLAVGLFLLGWGIPLGVVGFAVGQRRTWVALTLDSSFLALVVVAGLRGSSNPAENIAPTFVYITFWLGLLPLSLLLGDVFRALNPWRVVARAVAWLASRAAGGPVEAPFAYPERLGRWPAVVGIVAFGWLELAANGGDVPATIAQAALGTQVNLVTLDGDEELTIPPGTQPGHRFVLRGKGVTRLQGRGRGDLVAIVRVDVPTKLTEAEVDLLKQFAAGRGEEVGDGGQGGLFSKIKSAFS